MEVIEKITSYNIFTNLLPGAVFVYAADRYYGTGFISDDLLVNVFVFYFFGLLIGRVGSLLVEPPLKYMQLIRKNSYGKYIDAEKSDPKIGLLMEARNTYRSFVALCLLLLILSVYQLAEHQFPRVSEWRGMIATLFLGVLFLISFLKQDRYIFERVKMGVDSE
jgi:hypothetical protein